MIVVYVAGPYSAPTHIEREYNIWAAREAGAEVCRLGAVPVIPHSNTGHFDDVAEPEFFYKAGIELLERSDAVLMLPGWPMSVGSVRERSCALELKKPVFDSIAALGMWLTVHQTKDSRGDVGGELGSAVGPDSDRAPAITR